MTSNPAPMPDDVAGALRDWATSIALPFWSSTGRDARTGGFHERLAPDGTPDAGAPRRVLVQARQIYVLSHAAALGWFPEGARLALDAFGALVDRYHAPDGGPGFVHSCRPESGVENPRRDTYDHAFILLATAWLAHATRDAQVRNFIDSTLVFLDEHLAASDGTFHEGLPPTEPRRQNPHMHLFEAMLALHETVRHPEALSRAARLRDLLSRRFIDPGSGTLTEFFTGTWTPAPPGQPVEPGHHAEWSWLLRRHEAFAGLPPDPLADRLLDFALAAADSATGLLPEAVQPTGEPVIARFRCWAQTELAKALLTRHETGLKGAGEMVCEVLSGLLGRYLRSPIEGAWHERLGPGGAPIAGFVPASTLYHLFGAIAEASRVLGPRADASL